MSTVQAEGVLAEFGFAGVRVEIAGHAGELAALAVPEAFWERMLGPDGRQVADGIRALGFRYVALDLVGA